MTEDKLRILLYMSRSLRILLLNEGYESIYLYIYIYITIDEITKLINIMRDLHVYNI